VPLRETILALVEPMAGELGLEVLDVELGGDAARQVVRVLLDAERGVSIADCETVSRRLSDVLDADDADREQQGTGARAGRAEAAAGRYMLEVSSPGVNRPLIKPAHFRRVVGGRVKVKLKVAADGTRVVLGRLVDADDDGITVEPDGAEPRRVAYVDVERARVEYEFPDTGKPGKQAKPAAPGKAPRAGKGKRRR